MSGIIIVCIIVLLGLAALAIYINRQPDHFRVERSSNIKASAEIIFEQLNNFKNWRDWSPWEQLDPQMKREYAGNEAGLGATYAWEGNKKVGQGRMEIVEVTAPHQINIQLDFIAPFKANNQVTFVLLPEAEHTNISWAMEGKQRWMAKLMALCFNMDKMVGKDFEKGLAALKHICESHHP